MAVFPEPGEVVVCKVTKILDYGVFVELSEFSSLAGFVHISQVSSSWIKNIRNFVKENQIRAAQVIRVDLEKRQVDLSFNKVSQGAQRAKIEAWKQSKRAQKLLELIAAKNKAPVEEVQKEVAAPLLEKFETLFDAFQAIILNDDDALKLVPQKWLASVQEVVSKNVEVPQKELKGILSLSSFEPNGVELVKNALSKAEKAGGKNSELLYLGSGKFLVKATAIDFKSAEKLLKKVSDTAIEAMKAAKGVATFSKQ